MNDQRVVVLRKALDGLVDSLDATVRLERWEGNESVPEALERMAKRLAERRDEASRLVAAKVVGSGKVFAALTAMTEALRELGEAGTKYLGVASDAPATDRADEALALDAALEKARDSSRKWS